MEWPKELLEIFDDPLLDGVRPKAVAPTANDRMQQKLAEVTTRNEEMILDQNSFVHKEFEGYSEDLMWKIWDYAYRQGYRVFNAV